MVCAVNNNHKPKGTNMGTNTRSNHTYTGTTQTVATRPTQIFAETRNPQPPTLNPKEQTGLGKVPVATRNQARAHNQMFITL
jgi:hypothetical protein